MSHITSIPALTFNHSKDNRPVKFFNSVPGIIYVLWVRDIDTLITYTHSDAALLKEAVSQYDNEYEVYYDKN